MTQGYLRVATLLIAMLPLPATAAAATLYTTGFEPPTFVAGLLQGQDGWFALHDISINAAMISTQLPRDGVQSLRIGGANVAVDPALGIHDSPTFSGIYEHPLNYDPISSGTPLVSLSADLDLFSGGNVACGLAVGLGGVGPDGQPITFGLISIATAGFSFLATETVIVNGPAYNLGEWAHVTVDYDFENRVALGFLNGELIGVLPFTSGIGNLITNEAVVIGAQEPIPNVTGYIDNLSLNTVPEPGTLVLLSVGLLGLLGYAGRQRERRRSKGGLHKGLLSS